MPKQQKHYLRIGSQAVVTMPYSEVCMHMRVAGKRMVVLLKNERQAQLFPIASTHPFSAPILPGEAGLYRDAGGFYYYNQVVRLTKGESE